MISQTFVTGFWVGSVPVVGIDVGHNRISMVTRFLGLHQSGIRAVTTGFYMVMIELGL
jgi:hypothetical protein